MNFPVYKRIMYLFVSGLLRNSDSFVEISPPVLELILKSSPQVSPREPFFLP